MAATWTVCIDDTSDGRREEFVCAGALIGMEASWREFNKEWRKALNNPPSLKYFHGKEIARLSGEFKQFQNKTTYPPPADRAAANAKRDELRKVIERSELIGLGIGLLVPEFKRVCASHARAKTFYSKHPFEIVLQRLVYEANHVIAERRIGDKVRFISDDSNRSPVYEKVYSEFKKWNPKSAKSMLSIRHEDDKLHYGLQAADMAATTVNQIYRSYVENGCIPIDYPLSGNFWRVANIDESYLLAVLDHQSVRDCELPITTDGIPQKLPSRSVRK